MHVHNLANRTKPLGRVGEYINEISVALYWCQIHISFGGYANLKWYETDLLHFIDA